MTDDPRSGAGSGGRGSGSATSTGDGFGNAEDTTAPMGSTEVRNPEAGGGTTVDRSFIWIANSAEGTVSKIDTRSMTELGRYRTSPNGTGLPSRTTVARDGDVAVANRGGTLQTLLTPGETGVTKIYASEEKCVDANGNGTIDTSTGAGDVKAWNQDECVAWHTPLDYWSNRPVAWAPPADDGSTTLWTAGALRPNGAGCTAVDCEVEVLRLDGETGEILDRVPITGLTGIDFIGAGVAAGIPIPFAGVVIDNYGPYGGASDADGNFWMFVANTTQLIRVDAVTLEVRIWPVEPAGNGYGMTLDEKGRIFLCGALGISRFDPSTETWTTNNTDAMLGFNGCMTDGAGMIWVGGGSDLGAAGLHGYDAERVELVALHAVGGVKGVSIDVDGYVWGVGSVGAFGVSDGSTAWRVDPMTSEVETFTGLTGAYSYSDMTGFGLKNAGVQRPPD